MLDTGFEQASAVRRLARGGPKAPIRPQSPGVLAASIISSVIDDLSVRLVLALQPYRASSMTAARPPARQRARSALAPGAGPSYELPGQPPPGSTLEADLRLQTPSAGWARTIETRCVTSPRSRNGSEERRATIRGELAPKARRVEHHEPSLSTCAMDGTPVSFSTKSM
jgi:hypothetical protein